MWPYTGMVTLGNGYLSYEYPVGHAWELTPEGHVMAFAYGWYGIGLPFGESVAWTVEVRESSESGANVIFRQSAECVLTITHDGEGVPIGYNLDSDVTTTRIGGVTIDPSDATDYLYEAGSEEFSFVVTEADIETLQFSIEWWGKPYFMEVPPGAVLVITSVSINGEPVTGNNDSLSDLRTFQKNVFPPALTVDRFGQAYAVARVASNSYQWLLKKWIGGAWQTRNTTPATLSQAVGSLWKDRAGAIAFARRTTDWKMASSHDDGRTIGGSFYGFTTMWNADYRFVIAAPTADGGVVSIAVKGRKFGDPATTPTSLWFTRSTGVHPTVAGAFAGWITPVKIADIDNFEPYAIWQKSSGVLVVSNGREGMFQSDDMGHTWALI